MILIIVESPTKARTLSRFLGDEYQIMASMGHIRDLPANKLGVDIRNDFKPTYVVNNDREETVKSLQEASKKVKEIILATDPDREGEAIAFHTKELIKNKNTIFKRIAFHEITEQAIKEALLSPRDIDMQLVNAQQARRILDRLVGYKLSPLLWRKVRKGLSAGRVQTVAVRLVVEREREIQAFKPVEYWEIEALLSKKDSDESFKAKLIKIDDKKAEIHNKKESDKLIEILKSCSYSVFDVTTKETRKYSYPPFSTSSLQQSAANRLGWSAKRTMQIAQQLYEEGFITYMRTDSFNLSEEAILSTREYIKETFGVNFLPQEPRHYKTKSKVAQEAHEAIRPTNIKVNKEEVLDKLGRDGERLYDLIYKRMLSCQMSEAVYDSTTVDVAGSKKFDSHAELVSASNQGRSRNEFGMTFLLRANGSVLKFPGWLKVYSDSVRETEEAEEVENKLPDLIVSELLKLLQILPGQHFTQSPFRYTEATLIKALEERGIGRPSTYAPTMSTIQDRRYVEKVDPTTLPGSNGQAQLRPAKQGFGGQSKTKKLVPTSIGFAVNDFVVEHFPDVVDYGFTAQMENQLDDIANGVREWVPVIKDFYGPFSKKLKEVSDSAKRVAIVVEKTNEKCPKCQVPVVIRMGRFGKFYACSTYPKCDYTKQYRQTIGVPCPKCGGDIIVKYTKTRKTFYGCSNYPKCDFASWTKPKIENQS